MTNTVLTQDQMISLLSKTIQDSGEHYKKFGTVEARPAVVGEVIVTVTKDGKETEKTAGEEDYVIKNPGGEEYIIGKKKLSGRYKLLPTLVADAGLAYSVYAAQGECFGVVVTPEIITLIGLEENTKTFEFEPSWGGSMKCNLGDMLVSTSRDVPEVYRIAIKEFNETYKKA